MLALAGDMGPALPVVLAWEVWPAMLALAGDVGPAMPVVLAGEMGPAMPVVYA